MVTNIFHMDYQYLLAEFGEEKINHRYTALYSYMEDYIKRHDLQSQTLISQELLDQTVVDYFVDIYRLKDFHDIKKVNDIKIHAYTAYWLIKRKPIQLSVPATDHPELAFVNEKMVTGYLMRFLSKDNYDTVILEEKKQDYLDFVNSFMYLLQYRLITPQMLEALLLAFMAGRSLQYSVDYQHEK